jgi:hypothetical protein
VAGTRALPDAGFMVMSSAVIWPLFAVIAVELGDKTVPGVTMQDLPLSVTEPPETLQVCAHTPPRSVFERPSRSAPPAPAGTVKNASNGSSSNVRVALTTLPIAERVMSVIAR